MSRYSYDDEDDSYSRFPRYVSVAEQKELAEAQIAKLLEKGAKLDPVVVGRNIASSFWAKSWCTHIERYQDYDNRLQRGRSYIRAGSVIDLNIEEQNVTALVNGAELYTVKITFKKLTPKIEKLIQTSCAQEIGSVVELLAGRFSDHIIKVVTHPKSGLFPQRNEITLSCNCLDVANMCKHVAATLYGVGARLDTRPDLLFLLRGIDHTTLVKSAKNALIKKAVQSATAMDGDELAGIFGVDMDLEPRK